MAPLDLVRLSRLMQRSQGHAAISVGLIDGPLDTSHPDFTASRIRLLSAGNKALCQKNMAGACAHGTMVAGVFLSLSDMPAASTLPDVTRLIHPDDYIINRSDS